MTFDVTSYRLQNQHLSRTDWQNPVDVVRWLGAVQSQDFAGGKWAIGLRTNGLTEADVERAFADGSILRTHVMRPTWHFVTPADIRWLLKLTAPRVHAASAYIYRTLELDLAIFKRSHKVLEKALRDGKYLTREELTLALKQAGFSAKDPLRFTYMIGSAETEGLICSGPRRGKQFTYALLEERVPPAKMLEHDEAVVELARRYFTGHGPATLKDFIWWSGLSSTDAKRGLDAIKQEFEHEAINDQAYWFATTTVEPIKRGVKAYLLPNYDEYTVGYTDRSAIFDTAHTDKLDARGSVLAQHVILTAGRIVASWKRTLQKNSVAIEATPFIALKKTEIKALIRAAERYANFLNLPFSLDFKETK